MSALPVGSGPLLAPHFSPLTPLLAAHCPRRLPFPRPPRRIFVSFLHLCSSFSSPVVFSAPGLPLTFPAFPFLLPLFCPPWFSAVLPPSLFRGFAFARYSSALSFGLMPPPGFRPPPTLHFRIFALFFALLACLGLFPPHASRSPLTRVFVRSLAPVALGSRPLSVVYIFRVWPGSGWGACLRPLQSLLADSSAAHACSVWLLVILASCVPYVWSAFRLLRASFSHLFFFSGVRLLLPCCSLVCVLSEPLRPFLGCAFGRRPVCRSAPVWFCACRRLASSWCCRACRTITSSISLGFRFPIFLFLLLFLPCSASLLSCCRCLQSSSRQCVPAPGARWLVSHARAFAPPAF